MELPQNPHEQTSRLHVHKNSVSVFDQELTDVMFLIVFCVVDWQSVSCRSVITFLLFLRRSTRPRWAPTWRKEMVERLHKGVWSNH